MKVKNLIKLYVRPVLSLIPAQIGRTIRKLLPSDHAQSQPTWLDSHAVDLIPDLPSCQRHVSAFHAPGLIFVRTTIYERTKVMLTRYEQCIALSHNTIAESEDNGGQGRPLLIGLSVHHFRVVFPYKLTGNHWVTVSIVLLPSGTVRVRVTVYDSYGMSAALSRHDPLLRVFMDLICVRPGSAFSEHAERINLPTDYRGKIPKQSGASDCGVICGKSMETPLSLSSDTEPTHGLTSPNYDLELCRILLGLRSEKIARMRIWNISELQTCYSSRRSPTL